MQNDVFLNKVGLLCAAGNSVESLKNGLLSDTNFLTLDDSFGARPLPLGICHDELPVNPLKAACWQSRNNQFALVAYLQIQSEVEQAIARFGADRVGIVIGTSTSGIGDAEPAIKSSLESGSLPEDYHYSIQEMGNAAQFIAELSGAKGPVYAISTACSSGAKALASGKRLITTGLCDVVIAGGVDTLCQLTVQGFSALEAVSKDVCNPFSKNRNGINIGEAAALFVLSRQQQGVILRGIGESSDAHHISAPEPNGEGAVSCMQLAIQDAGLETKDIDYINLHGTATALNDQMESIAVNQLFSHDVLCSSTKPFTGHTLGAAGAIEAAICWLMLADDGGVAPKHRWDGEHDLAIPQLNLVTANQPSDSYRYVLSNSFAFGGNNIALILERAS